MKQTRLSEFFLKLFLFTAPFWILVVVYCVIDPFKVIWNYTSYHSPKGVSVIMGNDDYTTTQNFLNKYKTHNYNAYVFGNSRSFQYRVADWQKYIGQQNFMHMGVSDESIYGIEKKLELMDRLGCKIDYALLIIDNGVLKRTENSEGYLFEKHPVLSGKNRLLFQWDFLEIFFDPHYTPAFFDYLITGVYKDYMKHVMNYFPMEYSADNNELKFYYYDSLIARNPDEYYAGRMAVFTKRPLTQQFSPPVIGNKQKELLEKIKNILAKHNARYALVISPLYDQLKLNDKDMDYLNQLFGPKNVFNFSGINSITSDYHNYYEASHYLPVIAAGILDSIYSGKAN